MVPELYKYKSATLEWFFKKFVAKREDYLYVILPLYQVQMDNFISHAAKYGAFLEYADGKYTRILRMTASEAAKMPHNKGVPYIGRDDSGHALHEVPEEILTDILITSPYWPHCWAHFCG